MSNNDKKWASNKKVQRLFENFRKSCEEKNLLERDLANFDAKTGKHVPSKNSGASDLESLSIYAADRIANALYNAGFKGNRRAVEAYFNQIMSGSDAPPRGLDTSDVSPDVFKSIAESLRSLSEKFSDNFVRNGFTQRMSMETTPAIISRWEDLEKF